MHHTILSVSSYLMALLDTQQPDVCVPADPSIAPYSESSSTTEISCVDASQPHAVDIPEDEKTITSQRTMSTGRHDPHAVLISYISTLALCVSNLVRSTPGSLCAPVFLITFLFIYVGRPCYPESLPSWMSHLLRDPAHTAKFVVGCVWLLSYLLSSNV